MKELELEQEQRTGGKTEKLGSVHEGVTSDCRSEVSEVIISSSNPLFYTGFIK